MMKTGQLWTPKDKRRRSKSHRIIWVSACGGYVRIIRCGASSGRYVRADVVTRWYQLEQEAPARAVTTEEMAA